MSSQRALIALAVAAGLVAGVMYYLGAQRIGVVVAANDLVPGRSITDADIEMRALPPDALPAGAILDRAAAIGRAPRGPVWKGQLLLSSAIASTPGAFDTGVDLPTGHRAVAIPVTAAHAVGGAVIPGSRVDVIAVPVPGRAPEARRTELLAQGVLVIDVRGEMGGRFDAHPAARQHATAVRDRLGSVVVAVGPTAQMWIADRMSSSTFVLALVDERP